MSGGAYVLRVEPDYNCARTCKPHEHKGHSVHEIIPKTHVKEQRAHNSGTTEHNE